MANQLITYLKKTYHKLTLNNGKNAEIISFTVLRIWIGILGIALPFILVIGTFAFSDCDFILPSISHYYYSNMKVFFVGVLSAVSLFLFTYSGYSRLDNIITTVAAGCCFLVAIFPTYLSKSITCLTKGSSFIKQDVNGYHLLFAAMFFVILALMSIFIFTKSSLPKQDQTPAKRVRNFIYRFCGIGMIICLISMGLISQFWVDKFGDFPHVFWFESLILLLFGISWLTKAEVIAGD
jgi:hypothetical protein